MLSKKQQKKLKKLQKARGQQNQQQKQQQKSQQPIASHSEQQQQQALQQNNGDIDFNQIQQIQNDQQQIDVTFLIAEIREQYYHSMKTVLLRYGQVIGVTQSEVAGEVLEKGNLGNVVVAEDDQEEQDQQEQNDNDDEQEQQNDELNVYSVVTILPAQLKITNKVIKQALTSLQKHKQQIQQKAFNKCHQILKNPKSCSLLLSARLPNLPSFIVCDSHQVFVSDLQELKKTQPKHVVFLSEYVLNVSEVQIINSSTKSLDQLIFSKFEDYQFCQKSLCWWVGENVKSQRQKADLRKLYFVMKLKDYQSAAKNIKTYLDQAGQQN